MQYDTVQIPIKQTSSEHYAKQRALAETRYCEYCGKPLVRRYYQDGRYEPDCDFLKRRFCGRACYDKSRAEGRKAEREAEIAKTYRPCKSVDGLYVDRDGNFIYHGKSKAVTRYIYRNGRKRTALVNIMQHGKTVSYPAARLVCEAFKVGYDVENMIEYADGDIHNICADNLLLVSQKAYHKARTAHAAECRKIGTNEYQIHRLQNVMEGAQAVLHYFETGKMDKVNNLVSRHLYTDLVDWCIRSLHYAEERAQERVAEAIARMYEVLLSGHTLSHLEHYCKMLLQKEKRTGWYTHKGDVPKEIKLNINQLKLDCLWEKYKVTHSKH